MTYEIIDTKPLSDGWAFRLQTTVWS